MSGFKKIITDEIEKHIADGMTPLDAIEKAGAKKLSDSNIYYFSYGLYEDKVLFFKIN